MISDPLLRETDRCVKCGLCLPHCPTYRKLTNEADSPRGRIALIQALLENKFSMTPHLQLHLDRCLGCRACERACPSGVAFGKLIDAARTRVRQTPRSHTSIFLTSWLLGILSERKKLNGYFRVLPWLRHSRLLALTEKLAPRSLKQPLRIAGVLPARSAQPGLYPANSPSGKSLQLFIGCIGSIADQPVISEAIQLLTKLGYAVEIPRTQVCCGALHRHNGYPDEANRLCKVNLRLTQSSRAEALITLASACHLELTENNASSLPIVSITDFLLDLLPVKPSITGFTPLNARVAIHTPCSARLERTSQLLRLIPGLEVFDLPENEICCGSAGSYLLTQPELAATFGQDKFTHLMSTQPDILVTSNTGCAIQFRLLIQQAGLKIEVLHPVQLIHRQLRSQGFQT